MNLDKLREMIQTIVLVAYTPNETASIVDKYLTEYGEEVRAPLNLMYDPLVKFNFKLPYEAYSFDYKNMSTTGDAELTEILHKLANKEVTGRKDKEALVWGHIEKHPNSLLVLFLRKNLDLCFGIAGAKKLGIVRPHSPQKGVLLHDATKLTYPCIAEAKYNGSRLSVTVDETGNAVCMLLRGQRISIPTLETALTSLPLDVIGNKTIDGELVYTGVKDTYDKQIATYFVGGVTESDRIELAGRITSATANNAPLPMTDLVFVAYDCIPTDYFVFANPKFPDNAYNKRRTTLQEIVKLVSDKYVTLSTAWRIDNSTDMDSMIRWANEKGIEGFMIKSATSRYDFKKNNQWHKVKTMQEADLTIIDYKPHTRNPNWIGSLLCTGYIDGDKVTCWVGSGLNDSDRDVNLYDRYHRKVVMVTYMDKVSNDEGYSLTNPRIVKGAVTDTLLSVLRVDGSNVNF